MTPQELFESALSYYNGTEDIPQDYLKAYEQFLVAAEAGHIEAQSYVGRMLSMGEGVDKNYVEAVKWLRPAAEAGDKDAQHRYGVRLFQGIGIEENRSEAFYWIKQAAEQNHIKAMCNLGRCYYNGWGTEKDYISAYKWCLLAAEAGNVEAMVKVGDMLREGKGVQRNHINARDWYKKAGKSNLARMRLAYMYAGYSIFDYSPKEFVRTLYTGNDLASNLLIADTLMYGRGIPANPYDAIKIWQYLYRQGYKSVNYNLAVANYYGIGTDKNTSRAMQYLEEVQEIDNDACSMYKDITGTPSDKYDFRLNPRNVDKNSILGAELGFINHHSSQSIVRTLENNPSTESYFWLARLYQEDDLESNYEKSEEYFNKAVAAGYPYALYIQSINKMRGHEFVEYNLSEPFYLSDLIESCFPENNNSWLMDKLAVIYTILKEGTSLDDIAFLRKDWEKKLYSSVSKSPKVKKCCQDLFERCKHKEKHSLIEEYLDYIWERIERDKINTLDYPSMTFIDSLNKELEDSKVICYCDKISLKLLKYIDPNKTHIFIVQDNKNYILGNLIIEILGLKNVSIKLDDNLEVSCDTYVKIPDLRSRKNHEFDIRISDLHQRECIMSSLLKSKKIKKTIVLVNREFCSSYMTEMFFTRARLGQKRFLESVVEFNKDIFADINTSTSLLVMNFEKQNDIVRLTKQGNSIFVPHDNLYKNSLTLAYDLYTPALNSTEGSKVVRFCDIMEIRTKYDKKKKNSETEIVQLTDKDYQSSLLGILGKKNIYTCVDKKPEKTVSIERKYYGPHIFLSSRNGLKLNIQTDNRLCNPGYEEHAIKLTKDSPVTLEYLAYLLMSPETQEYISNIVDKNGSFMPRDLLYKEIAINSDKAVQQQIVEEALIRERQATGLGVEYNIVILSSKRPVLDAWENTEGIIVKGKDQSFEEIYDEYITDETKAIIDAIVVDKDHDEYEELMEVFGDVRERNIHIYIISDEGDKTVKTKKKIEYFVKGSRIYSADEESLNKLKYKLKDDLDSSNSNQAKIRMKYKDVFKAADALDKEYPGIGISAAVLRYIQTGCIIEDDEKTSGPCATFREVCHELLKVFIQEGLVPQMEPGAIPSLLRTGTYYDNIARRQYLLIEPFMSKSLSQSLEYFCKITNSAVHGSQNSSKLGTAALNILMEFIVWFYENLAVLKNIPNNDERRYIEIKKDDTKYKNRYFIISEFKNGKDSYFYSENIHFVPEGDVKLREGMKVKITSITCEQIGEREYTRKRIKGNPIIYYAKCKEYLEKD